MSAVTKAFVSNDIIPDVIPKVPQGIIDIKYYNDVKVDGGNQLTPTQVKDMPHRIFWDFKENVFYTLVMTDPDAPSRSDPKYREWHHWLVGNIPGCNVAAGETLSAYIGAAPPPETGLHRYVFLVYEQPSQLQFDEPRLTHRSGDSRGGFSIHRFAKKYKLDGPIAGNFYLAQYDDYVPILHKQLED